MKMLRWILSHSFLILLIVIVIYGYMYWGNLLGKETPAGKAVAYLSSEFDSVREFVDAVKEKQARLDDDTQPEQQSQPAKETETAEIVTLTTSTDSDNASGVNEQGIAQQVQHKEVTVIESSPSETIVTEKIVTRAEPYQGYQQQREQPQAVNRGYQDQYSNDGAQQQETVAAETVATADVVLEEKDSAQTLTEQMNDTSKSQISSSIEMVEAGESVSAKENNTADEVRPDESRFAARELPSNDDGRKKTINNDPVQNTTSKMSSTKESVKDTFVPPEIEKQLDNVDTQGRVVGQSQENDETRASWIAARKSFYQRNYELSEKYYQKVIDNTEDNFDAYGELGNVYFNQGKNKQAAAAYYDAAAILVRKGQVVRAKSLMGLLRHLDESKAIELQALIDSEKS